MGSQTGQILKIISIGRYLEIFENMLIFHFNDLNKYAILQFSESHAKTESRLDMACTTLLQAACLHTCICT